ncbi:AAA domain-containing protein [Polaromonas sp. OV174]|uniref:ATP-binding protein n=1 Tax=Polaromonas sp. OV174 TaxID=1855300 RepID=UPI0008E19DB4|nr:ATP-binding protein [Polaromonas sp. OV174]SFC26283.1 AAA domain-containing protein [Polaromonas sp. OV174]
MTHSARSVLEMQINQRFLAHSEGFEFPQVADTFKQRLETSIDDLFDVDLNPKKQRIGLAARHPMLDQRYTILTHEIEQFHNLSYDWAIARKSGLYFTGLHRQGKTTAIKSTIVSLRSELPFIAFLTCNGQRLTNKSKEAFCRYLLESWGYPASAIRRGVRVENVLANLIIVQCAEVGGIQCVLLIDEAQLFSVVHYRYLLELWNSLRSQGYILCTILVGQMDLLQLRAITDELDHGAVVSRFFVSGHTMGGIKTPSKLEELLSHYDVELSYPIGREWPYSRFFCKEAFDRGWRLGGEWRNYWTALTKVSNAKEKEIKTSGFRMAWIVDAVHGFLLDAMAKDSASFHGTVSMWEDLLQQGTDSKFIV